MKNRSTRLRTILAIGCAWSALASYGCGEPDSGDDPPSPRREAPGTQQEPAAAGKPKTPGVTQFVYPAGGLWDSAEEYLKQVAFERGAAEHRQNKVQVCDLCDSADVTIAPERFATGLYPADFDSLRVIGRVTLNEEQPMPELGLVRKGDVAYLLTTSRTRAVFMYRNGNRIAFTRKIWNFGYKRDPAHGSPKAEWRDIPHLAHARADSLRRLDFTHLSGAWIACAEGCCTAEGFQ